MKTCNVDNCSRKFLAKGYCSYHYYRINKYNELEPALVRDYHGGKGTTEYIAWKNMRKRCSSKSYVYYSHYGGRGIKVCDRWATSFPNFLEDMGKKPSPNHSLDRIDNDGNYEPSNCRWATKQEQSRNQGLRSDNTSGVRGVGYDKANKIWIAYYAGKAIFRSVDKEKTIKARRDYERSIQVSNLRTTNSKEE